MSKYNELFTPDMTTKQIEMLYFRLMDEVSEADKQELFDAHLRAWEEANQRESEAFQQALEEGYILCTN